MSEATTAAGAAGIPAPRASARHSLAFALAATLVPLGSTMLAVAMPAIGRDMSVDPAHLTTWLVSAYLAVAILGTGPGGRAGDALGAARALRLGQALAGTGIIAGSLASGVGLLVAARLLVAAGGAVMLPAAMALLREVTAPERRARAFGTFGSVMGFAAAMGPLLGGEITEALGWRATFLAQGLPLVISLLLARGLPIPQRTEARSVPAGAFLGELLRARAFVSGAVTIALHNCAMYAMLFLVPILLASVRGLGEAVVGRALLAMTLTMVAGSWAGGRLAERIGVRASLVVASLSSASGLVLLRDVASIHGPGEALPGLVLLGLGVGLANGPAQGSAMSAVPGDRSATAAGIMSATRYLGGLAGMAAIASVRADIAPALAEPLIARAVTFLLGAVLLSLPLALLMPSRRGAARDVPPRAPTRGDEASAAPLHALERSACAE